jgi:TonB family protein
VTFYLAASFRENSAKTSSVGRQFRRFTALDCNYLDAAMKPLRFLASILTVIAAAHVAHAAGGFIKPEPVATPPPRLSDDLISKPCTAFAQMQVNEHGFVTEVTIVQSSDPKINEPVMRALRRWKFKPATEDGVPVSCYVVQPVRVSSGMILTQPEAREDRDPVVKHSWLPELPRELRTIDGYVTAHVEVNEHGIVKRAEISDSTHSELDPFVLQAVSRWDFTPAVRKGQNAPCRVAIPFRFKPDPRLLPEDVKKVEEIAADSGPVPTRRVSPDVPASVVGQEASAEISFIVDAFGSVVNPTVLTSTNDAFAASALDAISRWRFKPAVQNGKPVAIKVRQQFTLNQQVMVEGRGPAGKEVADSSPKVRKSVTPEVPAALRGVKGQVDVWLAIDEGGNVTDAQVRNASYDEFSAAAIAAARQWKFSAAVREGKPVASAVIVPFLFGE